MKQLYFEKSAQWRKWLKANYDIEKEVWLVYYKKGIDKPTMRYNESVEEALCYGWIDSLIKKIDEEKFVRKFHPRKEKSFWSELNKKRVAKLIKENRMTNIGLAKIEAAKKNGMWNKLNPKPDFEIKVTPEFQKALSKNKKAKDNFENLSSSQKKPYMVWISSAKKMETQLKRINETIRLLENGIKLGLK